MTMNYPLDDERYDKLKEVYKTLVGTMDDNAAVALVHEAASNMLVRNAADIKTMVVAAVHEG